MKPRWDVLTTALLVVCALATTGLVVRRELFRGAAPGAAPAQKPRQIADWRRLIASGQRMGPPAARVQIIEFADFECPFCARFHEQVARLRARHPRDIALTFVHFPLSMHRFALPAARAAECGGEQRRFAAMHDRLFAGQQDFGLRPWTSYASEAALPDIKAFEACIARKPIPARITAGGQLAERLNVTGTPTLIVNGWLVPPAGPDQFEAMIDRALAGRPPVEG